MAASACSERRVRRHMSCSRNILDTTGMCTVFYFSFLRSFQQIRHSHKTNEHSGRSQAYRPDPPTTSHHDHRRRGTPEKERLNRVQGVARGVAIAARRKRHLTRSSHENLVRIFLCTAVQSSGQRSLRSWKVG
jgi:hypothetical protein